jgi:hypothetical protein
VSDANALREEQKTLEPIVAEIQDVAENRPTGEWMVNIAHYYGKQWAEWLPVGNRLTYQTARSRESTKASVKNLMPMIDKTVDVVLTQIRPPQVVPPSEMDIAERNRIEVSNALIEHKSHASELDDSANWELMLRHVFLTGIGCDFEYWDPKAGRKYAGVAGELYNEGDLAREIISPFDVFPQPNRQWSRQMNHITIRRLTTVQEIKANYGVKVDADTQLSDVMATDWQMRHLDSPKYGPRPTKVSKYVYVRLERPSDEFPDGREIHFTILSKQADRILYAGPNQNPDGQLQVGLIQHYPVGLGWPTSLASQLRSGIVTYNVLMSAGGCETGHPCPGFRQDKRVGVRPDEQEHDLRRPL